MFVRNSILMLLLGAVTLWGCVEDPQSSLYQDSFANGAPPDIQALSTPSGTILAGVTPITITGLNFSPEPAQNYVYFDTARANVLQATATQLVVRPPYFAIAKDSIRRTVVRVAVLGSSRFDTTTCDLRTAMAKWPMTDPSVEITGVSTDASSNIYVAMYDAANNRGMVVRYPAADPGRRDSVALSTPGRKYLSLRANSDGYLYMLNEKTTAFLRVLLTGGPPALYINLVGIANPVGFDYDAARNIWIVSDAKINCRIGRVTPARALRTFPFLLGGARSVRVFGSHLYVSVSNDTMDAIMRAPIVSADSLGTFELYFDTRAAAGAGKYASALEFSADGFLYAGMSSGSPDGILLIAPGGGSAVPLFGPMLKFESGVTSFTWGAGTDLFAGRQHAKPDSWIYYISSEKTGAPYYCR